MFWFGMIAELTVGQYRLVRIVCCDVATMFDLRVLPTDLGVVGRD